MIDQGRSAGHDGKPLLIDQLEQRLVASSSAPFGKNDRRTLRADAGGAADGSLAYDPIDPATNPDGTVWTAMYAGLDAADVELALEVESRIMWLGRDPLAGLELTISETGLADPPGPAGHSRDRCRVPQGAPFAREATVDLSGPTGGSHVPRQRPGRSVSMAAQLHS
jgi:hypothetical protein